MSWLIFKHKCWKNKQKICQQQIETQLESQLSLKQQQPLEYSHFLVSIIKSDLVSIRQPKPISSSQLFSHYFSHKGWHYQQLVLFFLIQSFSFEVTSRNSVAAVINLFTKHNETKNNKMTNKQTIEIQAQVNAINKVQSQWNIGIISCRAIKRSVKSSLFLSIFYTFSKQI